MPEKKDKPTSEIVSGHRRVKIYSPRQEISFAITEDCNLNCAYCYLPKKNTGRKMSFETARKAVDYLLGDTHHFTAPNLVIDFIGGEPLLEAELMDRITDYIKVKLYKAGHPWFNNYTIGIGTWGAIHFPGRGTDRRRFLMRQCAVAYPQGTTPIDKRIRQPAFYQWAYPGQRTDR